MISAQDLRAAGSAVVAPSYLSPSKGVGLTELSTPEKVARNALASLVDGSYKSPEKPKLALRASASASSAAPQTSGGGYPNTLRAASKRKFHDITDAQPATATQVASAAASASSSAPNGVLPKPKDKGKGKGTKEIKRVRFAPGVKSPAKVSAAPVDNSYTKKLTETVEEVAQVIKSAGRNVPYFWVKADMLQRLKDSSEAILITPHDESEQGYILKKGDRFIRAYLWKG
ncbi:MAG: hypothetical protein P0S95_08265 [Rhabdochlamydiaceae bacterium]|nr:hypothetical protein [Candidatus Amphrikana amoebophyrae]